MKLRTGQLLHPASTPTFRPTPWALLPGTLAFPRTGLAPAGSRELVARTPTSSGYPLQTQESELLDAQREDLPAPPATQNANLDPLVEGPAISLATRHAKVRREGHLE